MLEEVQPVLDLIHQNITALAAIVIAAAVVFTAYINYRNRAIRIEILREHTKALREIANQWAEELPELNHPYDIFLGVLIG